MGRIEPPPEGLAVLGASVRQGQILAYVQPAVGVVDRTQVRRQVAELTTAIRVETENLEILKQFFFVPFRDGTSGAETYGGGRYVLDTVKGSDLGLEAGRLVLDFNFAYNPSCSYDPRWVCPLSPPANRLSLTIRAGERMPR